MAAKGPPPMLIDCGIHGRLTMREIAERTGIGITGIIERRRAGVFGADLCKPKAIGTRTDGLPQANRPHEKLGPAVAMDLPVVFDEQDDPPRRVGGHFTPGGCW